MVRFKSLPMLKPWECRPSQLKRIFSYQVFIVLEFRDRVELLNRVSFQVLVTNQRQRGTINYCTRANLTAYVTMRIFYVPIS